MGLEADLGVPYANACDVAIEDGPPAVVRFTADPHGGPEAMWFCLGLRCGPGEAGPVKLVLTNPDNLLGGGGPAAAMRPVWRGPQHDWERLPGGTEVALPDGRREVHWWLERLTDWCEVAWCYPYGPREVGDLVTSLGGPWRCDTIGVSQGGRPLQRVSNGPGEPGDSRPGIYCLARQHAGETPGSWALDGFLRRIAEAGEAAPLIWCVPLSNVDGVVQGDYGKDNFPYDLNRAWGVVPMRHETLVIGRDVLRFARRCRPVLTLDWHAPGACETAGVYTYQPSPTLAPGAAALAQPWVEACDHALDELAHPVFGQVVNYPSRWETPTFTRWAGDELKVASLSFEVPYGLVGSRVLTRETYCEVGARLAEGVLTGLRQDAAG